MKYEHRALLRTLAAANDEQLLFPTTNSYYRQGRDDYLNGRCWRPPAGDYNARQQYCAGYDAAESELIEAMG